MTEEKKEVAQTEEQILFPEHKVEADGKEYVIKPWTFGQLVKVNPILEKVLDKLESKGTKIDLENFDVLMMKDIYLAAIPQVTALLIESLDITEDDINKMSITGALSLLMGVFAANVESFRSFFDLFFNPMGIKLEEGSEEEVKGQD